MITWWKNTVSHSHQCIVCRCAHRKCVSRYLNQLGILISMFEFDSFFSVLTFCLYRFVVIPWLSDESIGIVSVSKRYMTIRCLFEICQKETKIAKKEEKRAKRSIKREKSEKERENLRREKKGAKEKEKHCAEIEIESVSCVSSEITHVCLNCDHCQRRPLYTLQYRYPSHCISVMKFVSLKNEIRKNLCTWRHPLTFWSICNQIPF